MKQKPKAYVTTYCNCAHNMRTGKPIGHECRVIPPEVLKLERSGDYEGAFMLLHKAEWHTVQ